MNGDLPERLLQLVRCPRCKGNIKPNGDYLACPQCDIRYPLIDGIPVMRAGGRKNTYEDIEFARNYDHERVGEKLERNRKALIDKIAELAQIGGSTSVLSVGAGTGLYEKHLATGYCVALDYSMAMLAQAREKGLKNLICADARELPFQENTFDCVICIHCESLRCFEEDRVATIKEMKRVAKKRGQLIVALPNQIYNIILGTLRYANPKYEPYGVYPKQISRIFQQLGITVVNSNTFLTVNPELRFRKVIDGLLHKSRIDFLGATIIIHGRV